MKRLACNLSRYDSARSAAQQRRQNSALPVVDSIIPSGAIRAALCVDKHICLVITAGSACTDSGLAQAYQ